MPWGGGNTSLIEQWRVASGRHNAAAALRAALEQVVADVCPALTRSSVLVPSAMLVQHVTKPNNWASGCGNDAWKKFLFAKARCFSWSANALFRALCSAVPTVTTTVPDAPALAARCAGKLRGQLGTNKLELVLHSGTDHKVAVCLTDAAWMAPQQLFFVGEVKLALIEVCQGSPFNWDQNQITALLQKVVGSSVDPTRIDTVLPTRIASGVNLVVQQSTWNAAFTALVHKPRFDEHQCVSWDTKPLAGILFDMAKVANPANPPHLTTLQRSLANAVATRLRALVGVPGSPKFDPVLATGDSVLARLSDTLWHAFMNGVPRRAPGTVSAKQPFVPYTLAGGKAQLRPNAKYLNWLRVSRGVVETSQALAATVQFVLEEDYVSLRAAALQHMPADVRVHACPTHDTYTLNDKGKAVQYKDLERCYYCRGWAAQLKARHKTGAERELHFLNSTPAEWVDAQTGAFATGKMYVRNVVTGNMARAHRLFVPHMWCVVALRLAVSAWCWRNHLNCQHTLQICAKHAQECTAVSGRR